MSDEKNNLYVVTEVGDFGNLDIDDPTQVQLKKKTKKELEALIEQSIEDNKKIGGE